MNGHELAWQILRTCFQAVYGCSCRLRCFDALCRGCGLTTACLLLKQSVRLIGSLVLQRGPGCCVADTAACTMRQ